MAKPLSAITPEHSIVAEISRAVRATRAARAGQLGAADADGQEPYRGGEYGADRHGTDAACMGFGHAGDARPRRRAAESCTPQRRVR